MPLQFLGLEKERKDVPRIVTGLRSLDRAFYNEKRQYGIPVGCGWEVYGATAIGKSTFVYSLAGIIAREQKGNIVLLDLENFDANFLESVLTSVGMTDGTINILSDYDSHEDAMQNLLEMMKEPDNVVGILDSVGAVSPLAEMEGEFGEANMGKRAKLMAQYSRRAIHFMKFYQPFTMFMTNHMLANFSGYGVSTPGGDVKNYLNTVRIQMRRKEEFDDGSYVLEGKVKKNRWGYENGHFFVVVLAGYGIHYGLTAMFDGMMSGRIKRGKTVKIGDTSYGYLKDILKKAHSGDDEFFRPFYNGNLSEEVADSNDPDLEGEASDTV